ncbi:tyrosine protein phosphatase [Rhizobiales bacterium RZME27]|jgi:protein tyrosine/serine phosphatase|uniref:Tyrosine protein phosphatase n=1 Tax=Endobacterium cereale TaxID=2663029 RepID=A0A6A8AKS0_9HYPH|nr:tyrosine-protein phosphatase [Endobacterium cereale]MEB2842978.1 tyrosine-protein phosphatase [Endobacterium cereale]MQY49766.1 tyrosine protein phosphatase [Endobacterium cereale]
MRIFRSISLGLLAAVAALGIFMGVNQLTGNEHEVIAGELYRSGQPGAEEIDSLVRRHGIKTIINLRNEKRGAWYWEEKSAAERNGVTLVDYPISSGEILPVAGSEELAEIMRNAEKPILIHCEHGANRTGLASAIYVGAVAKRSEMFSQLQLSPYYGHVPIPGIGRYAMWQSWDKFEETIGF